MKRYSLRSRNYRGQNSSNNIPKGICTFVTKVLRIFTFYPSRLVCYIHYTTRPVVPGCAGCAMAHPDVGRLVNPISTRGDRLCPPYYYWHTRIFRPSDGPAGQEGPQPHFLY